MDQGLNLRFEYMFGKALSDTWQATNASANQIEICRRCSKGPTNFDVRHRAVASAVWELPFGRLLQRLQREPLTRCRPLHDLQIQHGDAVEHRH
jgi:hypothetical protein